MHHLKIVALLAVAAAALMAFAVTASADVATSPTGTTYTSTFRAQAESHVVLDHPAAAVLCASTFEGQIEKHGSGSTVSGKLASLIYGSPAGICTNNFHVTVVAGGTLSFHGIAGTYNSHVFSTGATWEITHPQFGTCRYSTNNTTIGTITGGKTATLHLSGSIPFHSGSIFCGSGATALTGAYEIVIPDALYFVKN